MLGGQEVIKNLNYVLHVNQGNGKRIKMGNRIDLVKRRFGRLVVIAYAETVGRRRSRKIKWLCQCDCGNKCTVRTGDLKSRHTQSCGCLGKARRLEANTKHGMNGTPTYESWEKAIQRCSNPKNKMYEYYGGRGITICERWLKFENFFKDMGEKPKGLTIERINNNGNYEPSNCKWATWKEQSRNSRHNRIIIYKGKTQCMAEWAEELAINYDVLRSRLNKYPPEIAFNM